MEECIFPIVATLDMLNYLYLNTRNAIVGNVINKSEFNRHLSDVIMRTNLSPLTPDDH